MSIYLESLFLVLSLSAKYAWLFCNCCIISFLRLRHFCKNLNQSIIAAIVHLSKNLAVEIFPLIYQSFKLFRRKFYFISISLILNYQPSASSSLSKYFAITKLLGNFRCEVIPERFFGILICHTQSLLRILREAIILCI